MRVGFTVCGCECESHKCVGCNSHASLCAAPIHNTATVLMLEYSLL